MRRPPDRRRPLLFQVRWSLLRSAPAGRLVLEPNLQGDGGLMIDLPADTQRVRRRAGSARDGATGRAINGRCVDGGGLAVAAKSVDGVIQSQHNVRSEPGQLEVYAAATGEPRPRL